MIFNKDKANLKSIEEFRVHVPKLDKITEFASLIPDIENAEFEVQRIIGVAVYERAEKEYNENVGTDEVKNMLYLLVQSAIANIAFRDYTITNDLKHSLSGRKASVNPANEKQAWEFFIERDNEGLNYRIQKALNRLIDYMDRKQVAEWINSKAYKIKHQVLLSDIDLFARYYPIENSLALFNQLLPFQLEMQRKYITPVLGVDLLAQMIALDPNASGSGGDEKLLRLIDYAGPALAIWTMATGIKRLSVKLLPEGLVQQFRSSVQSRQSSFPVTSAEKDAIVGGLIKDAMQATSMLETQIATINAEENSEQIFGLALGLEKPWIIEKLSLEKDEKDIFGQLDIHINFERGSKFKDENGDLNSVYDTSEHTWQHLKKIQHKCFIHARVPRTINKDNQVKTVHSTSTMGT